MRMKSGVIPVLLILCVAVFNAPVSLSAEKKPVYQEVDWPELMPEKDLEAIMNPPESVTEMSEDDLADQITNQLSSMSRGSAPETEYERALVSTDVRPEMDKRLIRIPGFIVPLEFDEAQKVIEFFLVPYFGACLHVPPPPPNQILYVTSQPGVELDSLMDAFWVEGKLSTRKITNDMATAAYSLTADTVRPYYEE